jgi:hypothetical protein
MPSGIEGPIDNHSENYKRDKDLFFGVRQNAKKVVNEITVTSKESLG